jgi:tetratricopeptide (TPR) repeat protein/peroxiredoxin
VDRFVTERYQDRIAGILSDWAVGLRQSPPAIHSIEHVLSSEFSGFSPGSVESRILRSSAALEVRENMFTRQSGLRADQFVGEFRSLLGSLSKVETAEFQIVTIGASSSGASTSLHTRVRYELVGSGRDFHREQRVGEWQLEWASSSAGLTSAESSKPAEFRLRTWQASRETVSRSLAPVFVDVAPTALASCPSFSAQLQHGADYWRTLLDGACGIDIYGHNGVSVGDFDDDGFDDLYVCQPAGLPNRLYRNCGDGTFDDITESAGVGTLENTACALFADIDNDGSLDLIVVCTSGPLLFLNQGGGKFREKPNAFHFANPPQGTFTGAAIADYDRDGWLDIYFCLYLYYQGTDQYKYPSPYYGAENGPPNFMMHNQRDGTFRDVTAQTGLSKNNTRYSFCCGWSDYNLDGWPDLYVVNDFGRKNLYRNNGDGTFTDVAPESGVEDVGAGMSVCWFDHDNDGKEDLYVANMWSAAGKRISTQELFQRDAPDATRALYRKHAMGNSLFRNNGSGGFEDKSVSAGVEMGRWSWASDAWDFDHDGFPDLYVANGMVSGRSGEDLNSFFWRQVVANSPVEAKPAHDYEQGWNALNELIRSDGTWSGYERNTFYANNRDGTFSDVSGPVGLDFLEDSRSFALADFDHDGRLEAVLKNRNSPQLRLLKNVIGDLPPSIAFRLRGSKSNRDAIGAAITIDTGTMRQTLMTHAGSGFLSQHSKEVLFGLGDAKGPVQASIHWPSGLMQELHDLPINHRIWVEEGLEPSRFEEFKTHARGKTLGHASIVDSRASESLPESCETWLLAPVSAPEFSLPDLNGQTRTLSAVHGKPVLLNFWTTESPGCREDLKTFNQLHRRWAAQGLQLLTINVNDPTDLERVRTLARTGKLSFSIFQGSDEVTGVYNILYRYLFDRHRDISLPTSFLIDGQGDIVKVYQGQLNPDHLEQDFRDIPGTDAERLERALPFPGVTSSLQFGRNYLSYGSVYFQRGYYDQSKKSFELALRDDPSSAEALYGMGSVYLKQQKNDQARESFERTVKLHASYPDTLANAWNNLGLLATRENKTVEAIPLFQEALRMNPDNAVALENLGNAYRQQKDWGKAQEALEKAVQRNPEDPETNYSLAMVFAQTDDNAKAYEYLQRALKLRPGYPEALNNLGVLYLRIGRRNEAVGNFEECIRVAPVFDQAYLNLARVYAIEGSGEKAKGLLLELLKEHPGHAQAQKMLEDLAK